MKTQKGTATSHFRSFLGRGVKWEDLQKQVNDYINDRTNEGFSLVEKWEDYGDITLPYKYYGKWITPDYYLPYPKISVLFDRV
jgi:hypothetical protein